MAKEPGNLNFNPSSLKLSIRYTLATSIFYHPQIAKTERMVHYALWRRWKSLKKQQKLEAFERFKGFLYKLRITRNLTILTPCRIQTLKLLLSVSLIKLKIQLLMTTNSAQALCYGILLHFQKLEVCGKNIKTNIQKNHTLLYDAKSIKYIPEKIQKKKNMTGRWKHLEYTREGRKKVWKTTFIK